MTRTMHRLTSPLISFIIALSLSSVVLAADRLADTDLPGGDYRSFELISPLPKFCENVCARDTRCKAWTFAWPGKRGKRAKCFLKEKVPEKKSDTCCISGIKGVTAITERPVSRPEAAAGEEGRKAEDRAIEGGEGPAAASSGGSRSDSLQAETATEAQTQTGTEADAGVIEADRLPDDDASAGTDAADMDAQRRLVMEEKRRFCNAYADAAMQANALNRQLGCGFAGGRWGASRRGYFNWCMRNPRQRAEANTRAREAAIARCRDNPPVRVPEPPAFTTPGEGDDGPPLRETPMEDLESCRLYARIATRQARRARGLGCGFSGAEWSVSFDRQFEACRRLTVPERKGLISMREQALRSCRRQGAAPLRPVPGRASAPYLYEWAQVGGAMPAGGPWKSGWRPSYSGKCPLVRACDCGDTCGVYPPGATARIWPYGCGNSPAVIQCRVRRRH